MNFTRSQEAARTRIGQDVCVLAGPGSGKTSVLTGRFAWLVEEQNVDPERILAITFTEKAAAEIRHRVQQRLPHAGIRRAPISTLHSLCQRLLREFSVAAGQDPSTELWDEREAEQERYAAAVAVLNEAVRNEPERLTDLFALWNELDPAAALASVLNAIASLTVDLPELLPEDLPSRAAELDAALNAFLAAPANTINSSEKQAIVRAWREELADLEAWARVDHLAAFPKLGNLPKPLKDYKGPVEEWLEAEKLALIARLTRQPKEYLLELIRRSANAYEQGKREAVRMDFSDLEHRTIQLLRTRPDIREILQNRYEHILLDETQDTNPVQWELLNLLRTPGGFFAVGDANQSIYGFRHAAPGLFQEYRAALEESGAKIDYLQDNFRSSAAVLAFTEELLGNQSGMDEFAFQPGRKFQIPISEVEVNRFVDANAELQWLTAEVSRLRNRFVVEEKASGQQRECRFGDIAILVRNSSAGEAIAAALGDAGIPAVLGGGRGFFENQEVIDLLQYFAYLVNPLDGLAMATVLRSPLVGLTDQAIYAGQRDQVFEEFFTAQRGRLDFTPPDLLLSEALDFSGYTKTLNAQGRANLSRLLELLRTEWRKQAWNGRQFADHLASIRAASKEKTAAVVEAADSVQILTVHKSKGLEFPVVLLAYAQQTGRGGHLSLRFSPGFGIGVTWRNPDTGKKVADAAMHGIVARQKEKDEQEANRLLFVALTRAEQSLSITWHGKKAGGWAKLFKEISVEKEAEDFRPNASVLAAPAALAVEELQPLPPLASSLATATPSGLATYANCPRRFYLDQLCSLSRWPQANAVQRPSDFADGNAKESAAELGTEVHEYLAGLLKNEPSALAKELAEVFHRSPLAARAARAGRVEREFDFVFAEGELVLEGQIDLWFLEGGEAVIVDYKTDRVEKADAIEKGQAYATQLAVYRKVIERLAPGIPVRTYLHFLRPDVLLEVSSTLDPVFLADFAGAVQYPAVVAKHCQRCPHAGAACDATL